MILDKLILTDLEKIIDIKFKDLSHLEQALIHRSFLNENKKMKLSSNERYEFLGDAILELWSTELLFNLFPEYEEGKMTNLRSLSVCTQNLSTVAKTIKLGEYVALSRGERHHGGQENDSILADTFESLIGAIYLDQGYKSVDKFLKNILKPSIDKIAQKNELKDPKSLFQEIAQAKRNITPHYDTLESIGPDHQKIFKVGVYLDQELIATGSGHSKQKAEEEAATIATQILKNEV